MRSRFSEAGAHGGDVRSGRVWSKVVLAGLEQPADALLQVDVFNLIRMGFLFGQELEERFEIRCVGGPSRWFQSSKRKGLPRGRESTELT